MKSRKIRLFHDSRHLCTRFRIDGLNAMSCGILGGKQKKKKLPIQVISQSSRSSFDKFYVITACCEDI